jgi:Uma2 family endonuclease
MTTFVIDSDYVQVPDWVEDLQSFRRWFHSDEFPETGRICYFNGEVWVDMSREQFFSHNQVKAEFTYVLMGLVKAGRLGRYVPDGMLLTNIEADISVQPDGAFVSEESLDMKRVKLVEGKEEGFVELEGTPDMVLEVVSASSVEKDTVDLREQYWKAGIPEYWLVDARGERLDFDILRQSAKGYVATRKQGGWLKSNVFGRRFRLTRRFDKRGEPEYHLAVR